MTAEIIKFENVIQRGARLKIALDQAFYEAITRKYACQHFHNNKENELTLIKSILENDKKTREALQEYNLFLDKYFTAKPVEIRQIIIEVTE